MNSLSSYAIVGSTARASQESRGLTSQAFRNVSGLAKSSSLKVHHSPRLPFQTRSISIELDCAGLAVFDDVIFDKSAVFDKAIFSGGSSFSRSSFLGSGYFIKSAFADTATFNNAVFSDVVFFDGTSFAQTVLFNNARIRGKSRFKEAKFSGDAHFNLTRFGDTASFVEALFARYTRFNGSTFSAKAYFKHTTFSGIVSFEGVNFFGETHFSSARFSQDCNFETSNFYASARFDEAEFEGMSSFDRAVFDRDAFFSGATFLKKTSLRSIKFGSNSKVDFKGIKVERAFDLGGAAFSEVPEFNQADFKQQPDLHNVQLWPLPFWRRGDPSLIGPYRHIKRLAKDHDCDNEHIGLKGELQSRRWSIDKAYWASSWLGLLYDGVSDCGRSIWRPLGIWFGSVVVFADIRAADQPEGWNCSVPFIKALFLSGRNALVLFSGSRDARITQAYQCLFGGAHGTRNPRRGELRQILRPGPLKRRADFPLPARGEEQVQDQVAPSTVIAESAFALIRDLSKPQRCRIKRGRFSGMTKERGRRKGRP